MKDLVLIGEVRQPLGEPTMTASGHAVLPVIFGNNPQLRDDEQLMSLDSVIVQEHCQPSPGRTHFRGIKVSHAELARLKALTRKQLTPEDLPNSAWAPEYEQYWLREDGALVVRDGVVSWGTVVAGAVQWPTDVPIDIDL